ncbi:hypothetical protein [Kitasatospora fiedleri]|uniref:hypothetical protein n=1 Tax=Kitasatospora fiedleri TaxID=2991545 RepID=UPI00249A61D4|nr:hypothetical protein [Kitasatospora fiedleri]
MAEIPGGYRVSVRLYGDGIDDREVLDTLAAGDRFGHSGSHRPQGDSRDKGAVWCEVYLEPPPRPGVARPETVRTGCHGKWPE